MYRVRTRTCDQFATFLSLNFSDAVDVILSKDLAIFVENSNELFAMVGVPCVRAESDSDFSLQINRSLLHDCFSGGDLEILAAENRSEIAFYDRDGANSWSVKFTPRQSYDVLFSDKINILQNVDNQISFDSTELNKIVKVAKALGGAISVDRGVASVIHKLTEKIYKEVNITQTFALTAAEFDTLRKCSSRFFCVQNYVGAVDSNFAILATSVRAEGNEIFQSLCGKQSNYRSKYIATVNFGNLVSFLSNRRLDKNRLVVSVKSKTVRVESGDEEYCIPISISNEQMVSGATFDEFIIPLYVLMRIMYPLSCTEVRLSRKQHFIELYSETDKLYILFS